MLSMLYNNENQTFELYAAGVRVLSFRSNPDGGAFVRQVIKDDDMQRLKDAGVKVDSTERRVVVC